MRQFYQCFPIRSAPRSELTWSHYKSLIRVENEIARRHYTAESVGQNWSIRALERQINSLHCQFWFSKEADQQGLGMANQQHTRFIAHVRERENKSLKS